MDESERDREVLQDMARDLPELAGRLGSMKDEALKWLHSPEYDTLRLRLEMAHSAGRGGCGRGPAPVAAQRGTRERWVKEHCLRLTPQWPRCVYDEIYSR